jgi:hypothetical protein
MKKLLIAVLMITAINLSAQQFEEAKRPNFTPDQIAELQTKKMTLHLELTENQQHQILEINKRNANERKQKIKKRKGLREKGEKPNSEELFKIKNKRLDKQIAHQSEMKTILNEQQFEIWKKTKAHKKMQLKKKA